MVPLDSSDLAVFKSLLSGYGVNGVKTFYFPLGGSRRPWPPAADRSHQARVASWAKTCVKWKVSTQVFSLLGFPLLLRRAARGSDEDCKHHHLLTAIPQRRCHTERQHHGSPKHEDQARLWRYWLPATFCAISVFLIRHDSERTNMFRSPPSKAKSSLAPTASRHDHPRRSCTRRA
jgi:hypothetical protein